MAIIFFDGFNRDLDENHWTLTNTTNMGLNSNVRSGSGPNSMHLYGDEALDYRLSLTNIGTHSAKTLYLGFALHNYVTTTSDTALYPSGRPFLRFYNSSNVLVLTLTFDTTPTSSNSQVEYGTDVNINVVQANTIVDTYTAGLSGEYHGQIVAINEWIYFEFELDIESATNTLAMHIAGMPLVNSNSLQKTDLTTISNIAKIEFVNGRIRQYTSSGCYIDDLYLVDNTGTRENTWLGPETVVRNVSVDSDNFDAAVTANQWFSTGNYQRLYSNDGDTSGIRTSAFNQIQLYNWANIDASSLTPGTLVGAVRISTKAKNASLASAYRIIGKSGSETTYDLSDKYVMSDNTYKTRGPEYILDNPETSDRWSVAEINSFQFGVKSEDPA